MSPAVATDSLKYCKLASGFGQNWIFANQEAIIESTITGVFKPSARWEYWSKPKEMRQTSA